MIVLLLGCTAEPGDGSGRTHLHRRALASLTPADISSEQLLPAPTALRTFGESTQSAVAYGGGVHLVAWTDA